MKSPFRELPAPDPDYALFANKVDESFHNMSIIYQRRRFLNRSMREKNFAELRKAASTPESRRQFLLVSTMIASVQRANAIE